RNWCSDDEIEVAVRHGFKIGASPRDWASYGIFFYGTYDEPLTRFIQAHVLKGGVCWDVGTERGWFSLLMASIVGPSGRVESFEAYPPTFAKLQRNRELNGFQWIRGNNLAISDECGEMRFVPPASVEPRRSFNSGVGHLSRDATQTGISVRTMR